MGVKIIYSDIALGAAENAAVSVTAHEEFSNPDSLPFGVSAGAVATCELNAWGLSKEFKVKDKQQIAFWSAEISDSHGVFVNVPNIVLDFTEQFTSTGLTLRFAPDAGDYCSQVTVVWYQDGVEKQRGTYYPDTTNFALETTVEAFDSISIQLEKTHLPNRRAKLEHIAIGIVREFDGRELTGAKFIHEIDIISNTVPVNVMDASFHSNNDAEFVFQKKQPVEAYNGTELIGVYYIESGERTNSRNYTISCQDAIGVLGLDTYDGGLWLTETPIETIIDDVVGGSFTVVIDEAYKGKTLKGYIPGKITRREALQHVVFALGACVDTSGTDKIKIFPPDTGDGAVIPPEGIYTGGKVTTSDTVTQVIVMSYEIFNRAPQEWEESFEYGGSQYAYEGTKIRAINPNVTTSTLKNIITFDKCFLCNESNAQERADAILAYYMRRNTYSAKHIVNGQKLSDRVNVVLPWGDNANANILKMTVTVSGITASDTEFLLD